MTQNVPGGVPSTTAAGAPDPGYPVNPIYTEIVDYYNTEQAQQKRP